MIFVRSIDMKNGPEKLSKHLCIVYVCLLPGMITQFVRPYPQTKMGRLLHMSWFSPVFLNHPPRSDVDFLFMTLCPHTAQNTMYTREQWKNAYSVFLTHIRPKARSMIHSDMVYKYD